MSSKYIQSEGGSQVGQQWRGSPITCDFCGIEEPNCFVDGRLDPSPANGFNSCWATMCLPCFKVMGKGIGPGVGQKYCKQK